MSWNWVARILSVCIGDLLASLGCLWKKLSLSPLCSNIHLCCCHVMNCKYLVSPSQLLFNFIYTFIPMLKRKTCPLDTVRKLNVHDTYRRHPRRLLNVLCTLDIRPVSRGCIICKRTVTTFKTRLVSVSCDW